MKYGRKFKITRETLSHVFGPHILCTDNSAKMNVLANAVKSIILTNFVLIRELDEYPIECIGSFDASRDMYCFRLASNHCYDGLAAVKEGHEYPDGSFQWLAEQQK